MCSGGDSFDYEYQASLGKMNRIQAKQRAKKDSTNVVLGGSTKEYRRSTAVGAKDTGDTKEDVRNKELSNLFAGNVGKGAAITASKKANDERRKKEAERWLLEGGGP